MFVLYIRFYIKTIHVEEQQFTCELCKLVVQIRWNLRRHLEEQHEIFNLEDVISSKEMKLFSCDLCEQEFTRKENLERHMVTHSSSSSSSKYTCTDCGKQFTTNFSLSRHQVIHASDRESFQCNTCEKTFSTMGNLARHIDGVHKSYRVKIEIRYQDSRVPKLICISLMVNKLTFVFSRLY